MTDLLSPENTGEIQLPRDLGETQDLTRYYSAPPKSPLPRPDVADTLTIPLPERTGVFLAEFQPDTNPSPQPFPAPVPAGPTPKGTDIPRPQLPPTIPPQEPAETAVLTLVESLGGERAPEDYHPRHRRSVPTWAVLSVGFGAASVLWSVAASLLLWAVR